MRQSDPPLAWIQNVQADQALLEGTLDVIILRTLGWGPVRGYAVARWIRQTTGDELSMTSCP